jgi:hypothetical protein
MKNKKKRNGEDKGSVAWKKKKTIRKRRYYSYASKMYLANTQQSTDREKNPIKKFINDII